MALNIFLIVISSIFLMDASAMPNRFDEQAVFVNLWAKRRWCL